MDELREFDTLIRPIEYKVHTSNGQTTVCYAVLREAHDMIEIKMSDVPLDVQDARKNLSLFGTRVTDILRRINFNNREKYVFNIIGTYGKAVSINVEVIDSETGMALKLTHSRAGFNPDMTDEEVAREIYILVCQLVVHETMEAFRFDGKVLFNPHDADRNNILFKAIEFTASATPVSDISKLLPPVPKKSLWQRIRNK